MGYTLRVSEANGYDTPWHVLDYAGFDQGEMKRAGFPIGKLAKVLRRPVSELEGIAYCSTDGNEGRYFKILGQSLGVSLKEAPLRLDKPAFCVHCVMESGHLDAFWDLSSAVACHKHRCYVLRACPSCARALRWFRPGLLTCDCGASLVNAALEPVSVALVEFMEILWMKLYGHSLLDAQCSSSFPLRELEHLPFRSFLHIASKLGKYNLRSRASLQATDSCSVMESAADVLSNWPHGYHQFLHRLGTVFKVGNLSSVGLRKQFLGFYIPMFVGNSSAEDATFLRDEFVKFGLATWGEAVIDKKLLRNYKNTENSRYLSNAGLARKKGVRPSTLKRWAEQGLVASKSVNTGGQVRYIFDADAVDFAEQRPGLLLDTRKAAAFLGLPVRVLGPLKKSGHFPVKHMSRHKDGFHQSDLDNFGRILYQCVPLVDDSILATGLCMSLDSILRNMQFWSTNGKADFVAAYLDGKIQSPGRVGNSWQDIQFFRVDVDAFAKASRKGASSGSLSQQEAAALIGCSFQGIQGLIDIGYLAACPGPHRTRVKAESIEQFKQSYIAAAGFAKQVDTTVARILRLCVKAEIEVLAIPYKQSSIASFFLRSDQEILLSQISLNPTSKQRREEVGRNYSCSVNAKLRCYLDTLLTSSIALPRRGSYPNKAAIAAASGFDRNVLYLNREAMMMLSVFDDEDRQRFKVRAHKTPVSILREYLEHLKKSGGLVPRRGGRVNRKIIALTCGIRRNILYSDAEAVDFLEKLDAT